MQKKILLIGLMMCCLVTVAQAQKGYESGYIVTLENDTVYGKIKDRRPGVFTEIYDKIRFKREGALFRKRYAPEEIISYRVGDRLYESVGLEIKSRLFKTTYQTGPTLDKVFLRVVKKGSLNFYQWEYIDYDNYDIFFVPLFHKSGSSEMVRVIQGVLGLKKKVLSAYLNDCPGLPQMMDRKEISTPIEVYKYYENCGE